MLYDVGFSCSHEKEELAIDQAINRCIEEDVLRDFLTERRAEVKKVMTMDYTFDRQLQLTGEEKLQEGYAAGREEEIFSSVQSGDYSAERGAEKMNLPVSDFIKKMKKAGYKVSGCQSSIISS